LRLPAIILESTVTVARFEGANARGETFATPAPVRMHVEEKASLRIDRRAASETAGTEITTSVFMLAQLDRTLTPGTRIVTERGEVSIVDVSHLSHPSAPSHSELWCA